MNNKCDSSDYWVFFLEIGEILLLNEAVLAHTQCLYQIHLQKITSAVYKVVTIGETSRKNFCFTGW